MFFFLYKIHCSIPNCYRKLILVISLSVTLVEDLQDDCFIREREGITINYFIDIIFITLYLTVFISKAISNNHYVRPLQWLKMYEKIVLLQSGRGLR